MSKPAPVLPVTLPSAKPRSAPWRSYLRTCTLKAAFCLITQIARFAPLYDVPLEEVQADVRAEFNAADKFITDGPHGAFEQVTYALTVRSSAPSERVRLLIEHAERACHAAQSLRQRVPVSLEVQLNGQPLPLTAE
jgi:hypothetical protein